MHLNPEGNGATTRNEHNTVLGNPDFYQNQQRRTPGAPHQSSLPVNTRPITTTDRGHNAQPEVQHDTQTIYLARVKTPIEQSTAPNGTQAHKPKLTANKTHTPTTRPSRHTHTDAQAEDEPNCSTSENSNHAHNMHTQ
ncbi:hypothetical protein Taro_031956 [Colocasia esculenta]|uniref:Uncharacterized protein n=1 Tax=Colocasia esculenta TaxID=4460 RepID=A0A843W2G1_COLES|nr:hypothetical protein [Colocasia esculenta]